LKPRLHAGTVVAAYGRSYTVRLDDGATVPCYPRGKRSELACGDRVRVAMQAADQGVVESVDARSVLFYRSDAYRQKLIAANVTQVVIVLATEPSWYEELLNRCLVAAEAGGTRAVIVLNKCDRPGAEGARDALSAYERIGYPVVPLIAKQDVSPLLELLGGQMSVLVGQSGMGKSTIINAVCPEARAVTAEVSAALDSGRHTTTHARLYPLDAGGAIIDSPGMQEFGLHHVPRQEIDACFPEFRPLIGQCRFANCRHLGEPGCAITAAASDGTIAARRLAAYRAIVESLGKS
jgi:ribosome biogenesis GTPase